MEKRKKFELSLEQIEDLISLLETRFRNNMLRHKGVEWSDVLIRLKSNAENLWTLYEMETTGGEPDAVDFDKNSSQYIFRRLFF